MGCYRDAGGAVHDHTVSVVGGTEGVAEEEIRKGEYYGGGEWSLWERGRRRSCRGYDAVGRSEDEVDVSEGARERWSATDQDFEGVRAQSFLCGDGS